MQKNEEQLKYSRHITKLWRQQIHLPSLFEGNSITNIWQLIIKLSTFRIFPWIMCQKKLTLGHMTKSINISSIQPNKKVWPQTCSFWRPSKSPNFATLNILGKLKKFLIQLTKPSKTSLDEYTTLANLHFGLLINQQCRCFERKIDIP